MSSFVQAPISTIAAATAAVTLYWFLRVFAADSASYRALAAVMGVPGRIERFLLGSFVIACCVLLVYRGASEWIGPIGSPAGFTAF
jgi:hypothetical protein